jgi:hypothetical protein
MDGVLRLRLCVWQMLLRRRMGRPKRIPLVSERYVNSSMVCISGLITHRSMLYMMNGRKHATGRQLQVRDRDRDS